MEPVPPHAGQRSAGYQLDAPQSSQNGIRSSCTAAPAQYGAVGLTDGPQQSIADAFAHNFDDPRTLTPIMMDVELARAFITKKIKQGVLVAGIGILFAIDLIPVAFDYLNEKNYVDASEFASVFEPLNLSTNSLRPGIEDR